MRCISTAARKPDGYRSRARGDWDGYSDTDLLVVAEAAEQAEWLPDRLREARVGDDVLALSRSRWDSMAGSASSHWRAIRAQACFPVHRHVLGQLVDGLERLGADVGQAATLPLKALSRMSSSSRYPIDDTPPADLFERADSDLAIGTAEAVMAWLEGLDQPR